MICAEAMEKDWGSPVPQCCAVAKVGAQGPGNGMDGAKGAVTAGPTSGPRDPRGQHTQHSSRQGVWRPS